MLRFENHIVSPSRRTNGDHFEIISPQVLKLRRDQASETDPEEESAVWNLHLHDLLYRDLGRDTLLRVRQSRSYKI